MMIKMSISTLIVFFVITTVVVEDACGQRCWIECDSPHRATTTHLSTKQGPPGKRGPSGLKGAKGQKGEYCETSTVAEDMQGLKAVNNEMKEKLRLMQVQIEKLRNQTETAVPMAQKQLENRLESVEAKVSSLLICTSLSTTSYTFTLTPRAGTFDEVREMCQENGGDLATSPFESGGDRFREQIMSVLSPSYAWVGIHDRREEGHFELVNDRTFNADDTSLAATWSSNEPNNHSGEEDCVIFRKGPNLNDYSCSYKHVHGICENAVQSC